MVGMRSLLAGWERMTGMGFVQDLQEVEKTRKVYHRWKERRMVERMAKKGDTPLKAAAVGLKHLSME